LIDFNFIYNINIMKEDSPSKGLSPDPKFTRSVPTTMETLETEGNAR
jgi:hypothetical protein